MRQIQLTVLPWIRLRLNPPKSPLRIISPSPAYYHLVRYKTFDIGTSKYGKSQNLSILFHEWSPVITLQAVTARKWWAYEDHYLGKVQWLKDSKILLQKILFINTIVQFDKEAGPENMKSKKWAGQQVVLSQNWDLPCKAVRGASQPPG